MWAFSSERAAQPAAKNPTNYIIPDFLAYGIQILLNLYNNNIMCKNCEKYKKDGCEYCLECNAKLTPTKEASEQEEMFKHASEDLYEKKEGEEK